MFQTFENIADPSKGKARVAELRKTLKSRGLAAFLVPRADEFQNEYTPPGAERLFWLTGFSGSAGSAIIARKSAALFVDGRYTLQAAQQVNTGVIDILQIPQTDPADWLKKTLKKGDAVGYDPRLHTIKAVERLTKTLTDIGATLQAQDTNPIDALWKRRPSPPQGPVSVHPLKFAGVPAGKKIAAIQKDLRKAKAGAVVLTSPESICWLLNIRGQDVPHTPLVLCFAIVPVKGRVDLFIDPRKVSPAVKKHLANDARIRDMDDIAAALDELGKAEARVQLDPNQTSQWFADRLREAGTEVTQKADPCMVPKAKKNAVEIAGARAAHKRDGIAVCRFLAWLDNNSGTGKLDEIATTKKLEAFRAETGKLKEISFDTISGAGAHGAIVHYRVSKATNAKLKQDTLYLVDSGAQYLDGTTDITRTVAIGDPTPDMRQHFTLVLKGHIAIAVARFPKGTRGADLDPLAREPLWKAGFDYDHGTGHGIGSYLSVHEGPQNIGKRGVAPLEPGMICSNEPGYYREDAYGIRIENLVLVTKPRKIRGGDRPMMGFETLTLAPIDLRLVEASLLSGDELRWLNAYHARVRKEIGPELGPKDKAWLEEATRPLAAS